MKNNYKTIRDINVENKTVVVRLDLNVPIFKNKITDETRINASLPTIKYLLDKNAKVIILSHLNRINSLDDVNDETKSLKLVSQVLASKLKNTKVYFCDTNNKDTIRKQINYIKNGDVLILENTRFNNIDEHGDLVNYESNGNDELAKFYASLGDVYVNDAFATIHRDHASNSKIALYQHNNAIGFLMEREINSLSDILDNPKRPFVAIFGGGKVKDKIPVIYKVLEKADKVIISGGMVYTFAKAMGYDVGLSRTEDDLLDVAKDILKKDTKNKIVLAEDYIAVDKYEDKPGIVVDIGSPDAKKLMGLDIGPKTEKKYDDVLKSAKTVFYNGPLGVFEFENFQHGTKALFESLANLTKKGAKVVIGGGDSASAAFNFGYGDKFSFISTGGGASLAFLEGDNLPGLSNMNEKGLTPHIGASKSKVSKYVLVCGDPLRAKWIAENFLTDYYLINNVRNMNGYSGFYKDVFITVMGHGMGMPSIGIYTYELYKFYDVDLIIRLGTAGALIENLDVRSLLLAEHVYSDSVYASELGLNLKSKILNLNRNLSSLSKNVAHSNNINLIPANIISTDCFYTALTPDQLALKGNSIAVEMEIFALYANALKLHKNAIGIVTISDNLITKQELNSQERQTSLIDMAKLGLEIIVNYYKNNLK